MFGAGLSAGLVKGGGNNGYDENKQYGGMLGMTQKLMKQAKLNKAKQSVNYGRTPGESGATFSQDSCDAGNNMFGNQEQRDMSMPRRGGSIENPLFMADLSGDGKVTQKDVGIGQGWIKPDKK
jgi:hypothetical protein|tara:strand:+ start:408 stop:776 length:369 start_codon:yes stop_codon:yes gene_type:complete